MADTTDGDQTTTLASESLARHVKDFSQPLLMWVERKRLLNMREYGLGDYENSEVKVKVPVEVHVPITKETITNALALADEAISEWEIAELDRVREFTVSYEEYQRAQYELKRKQEIEDDIKKMWAQVREGLSKGSDIDDLRDKIFEYVLEGDGQSAEDIVEFFKDEGYREQEVLRHLISLVIGYRPRLEEVEPGLYRVYTRPEPEEEGWEQ